MTDPTRTDRIIAQGKALVRAIEALFTIEPSGWFERWQVRLLVAAYKHPRRFWVALCYGWAGLICMKAGRLPPTGCGRS